MKRRARGKKVLRKMLTVFVALTVAGNTVYADGTEADSVGAEEAVSMPSEQDVSGETAPGAGEENVASEGVEVSEDSDILEENGGSGESDAPESVETAEEGEITFKYSQYPTFWDSENIYKYQPLADGTAQVVDYRGESTSIAIPSIARSQTGEEYAVSTIAGVAFYGNTDITEIILPDTIKDIDERAFEGCSSLKSIKLNDQLKTIGQWAFRNCISLEMIVIPDTVAEIGSCTFENCVSLKRAVVHGKGIREYAFRGCTALVHVSLGYGISFIGAWAFENCTSLYEINIPSTVQTVGYQAFVNCTSLEGISLNEGLTKIGDYAFKGCSALKSIEIPSTVITETWNNNTGQFVDCTGLVSATVKCGVVMNEMFQGCTALNKVTFSDKVRTIGWRTFAGCSSLGEVTLPKGLRSLSTEAFSDCTSLASIVVPNNNISFGESVFSGCTGLKTAKIQAKGTGIKMFYGCTGLTSVELENVVSLSNSTFENCTSLKEVTLGAGSIGGRAFANCTVLESVTLGREVSNIGSSAFEHCESLKSVKIPEGVRSISEYAFSYCTNLQEVSFSDNAYIETIQKGAFYNDSSLGSIYIPESVTMIGEEAFSGTGLGTGTVYCEPESYADNAAHYPDGTTIRYRRAVAVTAAPRFAVKGVIGGREVTFSCDTKDAVIYYSLTSSNLTTGDKAVQNGETVTFENFYGTVYAKAYANGQWSNVARLVLKIPVVNTPVITQSGSQVSIRTTTPNSMIYYTTDGSVPSPGHGRRAASPCSFTMAKTATVKAVAVRSCFTNSTVAEKTITLSPGNGLGAPAFKVKGVVGGRNVTFTSTTPGAVIYYSTSKSAVTTKDKSVKSGESVLFENFYGTVYAKTYSDGYWSNVSRLILKIPVVNQPTVTRASANGYVNISTTTPGCTLYYTTDGSTPSPNHGTRISSSTGRAAVGKGATIKVIAVRSCFTNSKVISFKY